MSSNQFYNSPNYGTINIHQTTNVGYVVPRRSWPRRHPILTAILVLFGLGFIANNWWILLVVGAVWLGVRAYRSHERRQELARQEQQRLIASAEAQNQAYLNGHQFGTHGHFPAQGYPAAQQANQQYPFQG
ncbi:hypothetical protein QMK17_22235 [Rhodococcus sp. G-MC3]|uniref:hypothetical protein n=1 Tax=Rhodococcus sp. G-MC3 TaxID=3046209 RepID=UPI0024B9B5D5|nr:hypothetical protein [Rhodococcus sp. G-MC3]MDJ0396045.1 hypothetical protein [Rhodococcus sp. G-MC3]